MFSFQLERELRSVYTDFLPAPSYSKLIAPLGIQVTILIFPMDKRPRSNLHLEFFRTIEVHVIRTLMRHENVWKRSLLIFRLHFEIVAFGHVLKIYTHIAGFKDS